MTEKTPGAPPMTVSDVLNEGVETASDKLNAALAEVISDADIALVHGHANFGAITPREVVNEGVRKAAVGYHCGHTQFTILREHGLITKPRAMRYDANLTKKGKRYARVLYHEDAALRQAARQSKGAE